MGNLTYTNLPSETASENALTGLALDLSWVWDDATNVFWEQLNPDLWKLTRNPWVVSADGFGRKAGEDHLRPGVSNGDGSTRPAAGCRG